jgi:plastocyanin
MLSPGPNLKLGVPMFVFAFIVFAAALYGGAQLVKQETAAANGDNGEPIGPGPVTVTVISQNIRFNINTITANAGSDVTVIHDNRDSGVLHNVAFYTSRAATQVIFRGELFPGPEVVTETFTAPSAPGTYFFRCDVHPDTMTGAFVVR